MGTRKLWWRMGTFAAVAAGALGFTAGPAYALPRQECMGLISDYQEAAAQSNLWWALYVSDSWTDAGRAATYDYPRYQNAEGNRISLAQSIMENSC
jgi:hypothetical protein